LKRPFEMPSAAQSAETRHRLLEAAGEVFADQGFRAATIQAICLRAGANIAAVHYHFGDKERLYRAVIDYAGQFIAHRETPPLDADAPPELRLRDYVESFLLRLLDEGRPAWHGRLMAREMFEPTGALDVIVQDHIRVTHQSRRCWGRTLPTRPAGAARTASWGSASSTAIRRR
jgi:AcrR family transcriptional regulator